MANVFATENLAMGQLPSSKAVLYTSTGCRTYVKNGVLVNRDTLVRTLNLYRKSGATEVLITPMNFQLGGADRASFEDENFTLGVGEQILGECDLANYVDFLFEGTKET